MAREAEHRGDNRAATYLHGVAAVNADLEARRARSDRYAEQQRASRLAANAAKPSDDPAVRAMTEHSGGLVGALQRRGK
jgi:hypothetical protein